MMSYFTSSCLSLNAYCSYHWFCNVYVLFLIFIWVVDPLPLLYICFYHWDFFSLCIFSYFLLCCCSVAQSWLTFCNPMDCSTPGFPVLHHLPEFAQTHVHWVEAVIQLSHLLSSPSHLAFNLTQDQGLFQWVRSSYRMAQVLKL